MITLEHYFKGRDRTHSLQLAASMIANAARTVEIANSLIVLAKAAGVRIEPIPGTDSIVTSGWRPPDVNAATPGAAAKSLHMTCEAIDIYDPDAVIDEWCYANAETVLKHLGVWMEHPAATKGWAHLQIKPPRSGRRVFYP